MNEHGRDSAVIPPSGLAFCVLCREPTPLKRAHTCNPKVFFWARKITRRERWRMYLSWPWIRQTPPLYRLTMWWMNRNSA